MKLTVFHQPVSLSQTSLAEVSLTASRERYPFDQMRQIPLRGSSTTTQDGKVTWTPVAKGPGFNPVGRWQQW